MYKKRFSKWGFQKNSRRSARASPSLGAEDQGWSTAPEERIQCRTRASIPACPDLCYRDVQVLVVLRSVWQWGAAFFESLPTAGGPVASFHHRPSAKQLEIEKTKEVGLVLKLAVDALARGQGILAGRIARKAFILVEKMFTLDGPALAWNLLVIMYDAVNAHQTRLLEMLLAHLLSLARCRMPKGHPLLAVLSTLQKIALQPDSGVCRFRSLSTASPSSPSTSMSSPKETPSAIDTVVPPNELSTLLERAWITNAELLFAQLDTRFFQVYCDIDWDSSSMILPTAMVDRAHQWFSRIEAKDRFSKATATRTTSIALPSTDGEENVTLRRLSTVQISTLSLREYETLWASCVAVLRRDWDTYLHEQVAISGDTAVLIRALCGLLTANVLEDSLTTSGSSKTATYDSPEILRVHASHLACVIRASLDLRHLRNKTGGMRPVDSIKRMEAVVALFEHAYGETDPRVLQEMRSIEEALITKGDHNEADRVGDDVSNRLEQYIRHIPPDAM